MLLPTQTQSYFAINTILIDEKGDDEYFIGFEPSDYLVLDFLGIININKYSQVSISQGLTKLTFINNDDNIDNMEIIISVTKMINIITKLAELRYPIYDVFCNNIEYV